MTPSYLRIIGTALLRAAKLGAFPAIAFATGCFTSDAGLEPPTAGLYFPTGLAISRSGSALYVTNSDFDIQYNAGTVQVLDLPAIRATASALAVALGQAEGGASGCSAVGLSTNGNVLLHPSPCTPLPVAPLVRNFASIGAFASGALLAYRPDGEGARLFVPVRGDPSVTYFDVSDDRTPSGAQCAGGPFCLDCGGEGDERRCARAHRVGEEPSANSRNLSLPVEPMGIAATPSGDAFVVAHQTEGSASLIQNQWDGRPELQFVLTGLPAGPTEIASIPIPKAVQASGGAILYQPGFAMTFNAAPELDLLRYYGDDFAAPPRPFLTRAGAFGIGVNAAGFDSRGIAIDASARERCEEGCGPSGGSGNVCLESCAAIPMRVFVANRSPATLLVGTVETTLALGGDSSGASDRIAIHDTIPISFGASKVAMGSIIDRDGKPSLRAFIVTFDARLIYAYDPEARRIDAIIRTGRGPHAIAFDTAGEGDGRSAWMYVGHFTDSYIGVVDLDMRRPHSFGSMILTIGEPLAPRETK